MKKIFKIVMILLLLAGLIPSKTLTVQAISSKNTTISNQKKSSNISKSKLQKPLLKSGLDDDGFSDEKTMNVLDDNAQLTLKVTKDGSSISTSVGDKIHVDVTLKKISDASELTGHENASLIIPYPTQDAGFTINNAGTFQYNGAVGTYQLNGMDDTNLSNILTFYDAAHDYPIGQSTGAATQVPGLNGVKGQSIFDNLVMKDDQISFSYDSEINANAVGKDSFTIASGFFDSEGTGFFTDELKIKLPGNKITDWGLQLDKNEMDVTVDPKDNSTLVNSISGNWSNYSGAKPATMQYQVDGGAKQDIADTDLNQTNKTFTTKFDLSKSDQSITSDGDHKVKFFATIDSIVQEVDLIVHVTIKKNTPPTITLNPEKISVQENDAGQYDLNIKGLFNDADSSQVTISGTYADGSALGLSNNTFDNKTPNEDTAFDLTLTTSAGKLKIGDNKLTLAAKDSDGATSSSVELIVTVVAKAVNQPPVLSLNPTSISVQENDASQYDINVKGTLNDIDSNQVTIEGTYEDGSPILLSNNTFDNNKQGEDIDFSLALTTTAGKLKLGDNKLTFIAKDSDGATSSSVELTVTVIAKAVNQPPVLTLTNSGTSVTETTSGSYDIQVPVTMMDKDSDNLTMSATYPDGSTVTLEKTDFTNSNKGTTFPYTYHITTAAGKLKLGDNIITFNLSDNDGNTVTEKFTVTVTEKAVNQPPVLKMVNSGITVEESDTGTYALSVAVTMKDVDSDNLKVTATYPNKTTISLDQENFSNPDKGTEIAHTFKFTAPSGKLKPGDNILTFELSDGSGNRVQATYTVTINEKPTNQAPVIKLTDASTSVTYNSKGVYDFNVKGLISDNDSNNIKITGTYADGSDISLSNNTFDNTNKGQDIPFDLSITSAAGKLRLGDNILTFTAIDNEGSKTTTTFKVSVYEAPNAYPTMVLSTTNIQLVKRDSGEYKYTLKGTWNDKDSDSVKLVATYSDGTKVETDNYDNNSKGTDVPFEFEISSPVSKLNGTGNNILTVNAVDSGGKGSVRKTVNFTFVDGELKFGTVATDSSFTDSIISSGGDISNHNDDWDVNVSDTLTPSGDDPTWRLQATQNKAFTDPQTNKNLVAPIQYKKSNGDVLPLTIGTPIDISMQQNSADTTLYSLGWTTSDGFQLPISDSDYAGNYQTSVTWTLVDAP